MAVILSLFCRNADHGLCAGFISAVDGTRTLCECQCHDRTGVEEPYRADAPLMYNGRPLFDESGMTEEQVRRARRLAYWWMANAAADCAKMIPKAIRYGSADLKLMGLAMQLLFPQLADRVHGEELAIWFYELGKVARLLGQYAQGEEPDEDSWYDLKIYAMMAKHVRETGDW